MNTKEFDDSASACAIDALSIIWYVAFNTLNFAASFSHLFLFQQTFDGQF